MIKLKTTLMNILKIACAGLMLLFMTPAAHAESALMKMPYSIEFGQPLSAKLKRIMESPIKNGDDGKKYEFTNKFRVYVDNDGLVYSLYFGTSKGVPKRWKRLGLKICGSGEDGASKREVLAIVKKEGAQFIEWDKNNYYNILKFELGGKYGYDLRFKIEGDDSCNKDSLIAINIDGDALNEDY